MCRFVFMAERSSVCESARRQPMLLRFHCAPRPSTGEESSWAQWLIAVVGSVPRAWAGVVVRPGQLEAEPHVRVWLCPGDGAAVVAATGVVRSFFARRRRLLLVTCQPTHHFADHLRGGPVPPPSAGGASWAGAAFTFLPGAFPRPGPGVHVALVARTSFCRLSGEMF